MLRRLRQYFKDRKFKMWIRLNKGTILKIAENEEYLW